MAASHCISLQDVRDARQRIRAFVHETPVFTSQRLNELASRGQGTSGPLLYFKCEAMQKTGSFKARGAHNAVLSLPKDLKEGFEIVTHSSGNHAQAVAYAAQSRGIPACIIMPKNAPKVKVAAVKGYGARIVFCEPTQEAREENCDRELKATGGVLVHPSNDPLVMAGQGTIALEFLEQVPDLDCLVIPIGGGGMVSGMAVAAKTLKPDILIIAAEPSEADDAYRSKEAGHICTHAAPPQTIADGVKSVLGDKTWPIVRDLVDVIITVSEDEISYGMKQVWSNLKVVIEPTAGLGLAAVLSDKWPGTQLSQRVADGRRPKVGIVLCGGNVDIDHL